MSHVIYDIDNVTNTYDGHMVNRFWTMMPEGLTCVDCVDISSMHETSVRHGKDYDFDNFTKLRVSGIYEVELRQDDEFKVSVAANDDLFYKTQISQEGNELIIETTRDGLTWNEIFRNHRRPKLYITMPDLEYLGVEGIALVDIRDFEGDMLELNIEGASKLDGVIDMQQLKLNVEGAAKVDMEGQANELTLEVAGVGRIDMDDLLVNDANVDIEGGGKAYLNITDNLNVTLKGVSEVAYHGEPEVVSDLDGIARLRNY